MKSYYKIGMLKIHLKTIIKYFFQGLIALLPLFITWIVVALFIRIIHGQIDAVLFFIPGKYRDIPALVIFVEIFSTVFLFLMIALFGLLVKSFVGKHLIKNIDNIIMSIPGIKLIYKTSRQFSNLIVADKKTLFMKPMLVEYPSPGLWVIGFITGEMAPELSPDNNKKYYTAFIPTTPNPSSGFLLIVPEDKIQKLKTTTEDAVKLILTGGMVKT